MSHVFFLSYASENLDKELRAFFEDLCAEVGPYTPWAPEDPRVAFRDGKNLPLMEEWRPAILDALQTSAVLVCATSLAYFKKAFCGQEFWIFDRRRRHNLMQGDPVPSNILPVIWAHVPGGLPAFFGDVQWQHDNMPATYHEKGLRYLKKLDPTSYEKCVTAFADAIRSAWQQYAQIPPVTGLSTFDQIPNAFAGGQWEEAAGPMGWRPGPNVANFIFAAALTGELRGPPGRHGASASHWRPYLPPVARTVSEIAQAAAKRNGFLYREILVNDQLVRELKGAKGRKNLTLFLADAQTLPMPQYKIIVATVDELTWEGVALLLPWDDAPGEWKHVSSNVTETFPIQSRLPPPAFQGPIRNAEELEKILDLTLTGLRAGLIKVETEKKAKTDEGPAVIVGPGDPS